MVETIHLAQAIAGHVIPSKFPFSIPHSKIPAELVDGTVKGELKLGPEILRKSKKFIPAPNSLAQSQNFVKQVERHFFNRKGRKWYLQ